nr:MAG TPA: hypothetical protein [Bacteriophage sp.]
MIVQIYNIIFKFPNNFKKKKIKNYEKSCQKIWKLNKNVLSL